MSASMRLKAIELNLAIGWPEQERLVRQTVWLDITIDFSTAPGACHNDQLQDTVCYQKIIEDIQSFCANKTFKLIEHLAFAIYHELKHRLGKSINLQVKILKRPPILSLTGGVEFYYGDNVTTWSC